MAFQTDVELTLKLKFTLIGNQKTLSQNQFDKMARLSKKRLHITSYNVDSITSKEIEYKGRESLRFTAIHRRIIEKCLDKNYRFYKSLAYNNYIVFLVCPVGGNKRMPIAFIIIQGKDVTIIRNAPALSVIYCFVNQTPHQDITRYRPITLDLSEPDFEESLTKALSAQSLKVQL